MNKYKIRKEGAAWVVWRTKNWTNPDYGETVFDSFYKAAYFVWKMLDYDAQKVI